MPACGWKRPRKLCDEIEAYLRQQIPKNELNTILDNIGLPYSGINLSYSNSGVIGTSDAEILVGLNAEHHHSTEDYVRRLREELPRRFPGVEFFFQPADIVTQILNFGLPAPIDIQLTGPDMVGNYYIAQQIANRVRHVPGTADVHVQQMLDLPTLHMNIERDRVTQVGMSTRDVAQSVLVSLSGSFQTAPNFWLNPKNGVSYQIAVQSPQYRMTSMQDLLNTPVNDPSTPQPQVLGNLVQISPVVPRCGGFALQRAARDRRVRQHPGPRSGRRGPRHQQGARSRSVSICRAARS